MQVDKNFDVVPLEYFLHFDFIEKLKYKGECKIKIFIKKPTSKIQLHANKKSLNLLESDVIVTQNSKTYECILMKKLKNL